MSGTENRKINNLFVKPNQSQEYYDRIKDIDYKPEYLIPLDGWFSMIIYPSISIKNSVQTNQEIQELIKKVKQKGGVIKLERNNWPIEIDLDACKNF